jgi:hypothetical protein
VGVPDSYWPSRLARLLRPAVTWPVSKEAASRAAEEEAVARGLPWELPLSVTREFGNRQVWTKARHRGGNLRIEVDAGTGHGRAVHGPMSR